MLHLLENCYDSVADELGCQTITVSPRFQLALLCAKFQASLTCALVVRNTVCTARDWYAKSISNGAQYVTPDSKIYCEKSKGANLAQEMDFSSPNLCSLLAKGATQFCTSKKECNKLDLNTVFLIGRS